VDDLNASSSKTQVRVVLSYDVAADDRRDRAAEAALDFIPRSQLSVFDGWLPTSKLSALWEMVNDVLKTTDDAAFMLVFCQPCACKADGIGGAFRPDPPDTGWII